MTRLIWDTPGTRRFETGVDRGVLFLTGAKGIPWNGLTEVSDTPDGGAVTSYWLDGVKYLDMISGEDYKASLSAFTYPDEFEPYQGMQQIEQGLFATAQPRVEPFSLSYRSKIANDTVGDTFAYRIHIVLNASVQPVEHDHKSQVGTAEADPLKWNLTAVPAYIPGYKPTAHLIIDSRYTDAVTLQSLETILYGSNDTSSHLPTIDNLLNVITQDGSITITDNGDGTWTAIGPNEFIEMLDDKTFQITNANSTFIDDDTYVIQDTDSA